MAGDLGQAVARTRRSYEALYKGSQRHRDQWTALRPQDDHVTYADLINDADWRGLARASASKLTAYGRVARQLVAYRELVGKQFELNRSLAPVFEREFVPPRARPDWHERSRALREDLHERGLSRRKVGTALKTYSSLRADTVTVEHRHALANAETEIAPFARRCFAGLMGAHLAGAVAEFNLAVKAHVHEPRDAAGATKRTVAVLERTERGYWQTLQRERIPSVDLGPSADLRKRLSDATTYAAALAVQRKHDASTAEHRAALEAADAIRAVLRHYALRYQLHWAGSALAGSPELSEWWRGASHPFASAARPPRRGSVPALAARPRSVRAGTPLTIEGLLVGLAVRHPAGKAISIATVRDARGHEVTVAAKHRKLDSSGMVPGSFVRISGEWAKDIREIGKPALSVERLALNDLAEQSWTDWVTARMRGTYEPTPQAITAGWSWEPGVNGAGNPLRYRVWYEPERRG
jgi:hypothetical protein